MIDFLIIADDFTGALDTAVQFAKQGFKTIVYSDHNVDFGKIDPGIRIVAINAETRHLQSDEAYSRVHKLIEKAKKKQILNIYKKTDSALRGNIGPELQAVIDSSNAKYMFFLPGYPKAGRTTVQGVHYCAGAEVSKTVFADDPLNPVKHSYIPDLFDKKKTRIRLFSAGETLRFDEEKTLFICDAETEAAIEKLVRQLKQIKPPYSLAGSAGFAEYLPLLLEKREPICIPKFNAEKLIIVSCSIHPTAIIQMKKLCEANIPFFGLSAKENLARGYLQTAGYTRFVREAKLALQHHDIVAFGAAGDLPPGDLDLYNRESETINVDNVGQIIKAVLSDTQKYMLAVTGGDTLRSICSALYGTAINPLIEIEPGVVLSAVYDKNGRQAGLITKAGSFGDEETMIRICGYVKNNFMDSLFPKSP